MAGKYKGMGSSVTVPKRIKPDGSPPEDLIYASREEQELLKEHGGAGERTQFGPRSYKPGDMDQPGTGYGESIVSEGSQIGDEGEDSNTSDEDIKDQLRSTGYTFVEDERQEQQEESKPAFNTAGLTETKAYGGGDPGLADMWSKVMTDGAIDATKYSAYVDAFKGSSEVETRTVPPGYSNSGQSYTVTITSEGHPDADKFPESPTAIGDLFMTDQSGNIIGYKNADGTNSLTALTEGDDSTWQIDSDGNYSFTGKNSMGGFEGEGTTAVIKYVPESKTYSETPIEVGSKSFEEGLGFSQEKLEEAEADRAARVVEMGARKDYYGGTLTDAQGRTADDPNFDDSTAEFKGGKEQELYQKGEKYDVEYDRLMKEGEEAYDDLASKGKSEYEKLVAMGDEEYARLTGKSEEAIAEAKTRFEEKQSRASGLAGRADIAADKAQGLASQQAQLAQDKEFYRGLQTGTDKILEQQKAYRGRIDELADTAGTRPSAMQQAMFAQRSEQIDKDTSAQGKQLDQMLAARGISPSSPLALRMKTGVNTSATSQKREARRSSLFDAMQMKQAQDTQKAGLYSQAAGMTQGELSTLQSKAGLRGQRVATMGAAVSAQQAQAGLVGQMADQASADAMRTGGFYQQNAAMLGDLAKSKGAYYQGRGQGAMAAYGGLAAQTAQTKMGMAGMQAARSSDMFSRGSYFGQQSQNLNNLMLSEAMDRQYGQENKKQTAMSLRLSKYGIDKKMDLAEAIANIKANAGASGDSANRSSLLGALAGGVGGYFLSGGNPYMSSMGATWGSKVGGDLKLP